MTLLRDPVQRFLSSYFYQRRRAAPHATIDQELDRYVETRRARHAGAIYVRFFAGDCLREPTEERVQRALANLERLQLVGITEALEPFALAFGRRFGLPLSLGWRNPSPEPRERVRATVTPGSFSTLSRTASTSTWSDIFPPQWQM